MFLIYYLACSTTNKVDSGHIEDTSVLEPSADSGISEPSSDEPGSEPSEPTGEPESAPCANEVLYVNPTDQQQDVLYRTDIEVGLLEADETAYILLYEGDTQIQGETLQEDMVVRFVPTQSLSPDREYTVEIHYCDDQVVTSTFHTGLLGDPVEQNLTGQTYVFDLRQGTWTQPVGVGTLFSSQFTANVLFGVDTHQGEVIEPLITISEESSNEQDMCFPSIGGVVEVNFSQNPYFSIDPIDVNISVSGFPLSVEQFELSGVLHSDGMRYEHGRIAGFIDARNLEAVISLTAVQVCDLLGGFGSPCQPCADTQSFCFDLEVRDLVGPSTATPLTCVQFANCHPDCTSNSCPDPYSGICP